MKYIIIKSTRIYNRGVGYAGVSCINAGIPIGKIYTSLKNARSDCQKLNRVNPVGFKVKKYKL